MSDEIEPWLEIYDAETDRRIAALPMSEPRVLSFPATSDTAAVREYRFVLRMVAPPPEVTP